MTMQFYIMSCTRILSLEYFILDAFVQHSNYRLYYKYIILNKTAMMLSTTLNEPGENCQQQH